jgi:hypothetical protein
MSALLLVAGALILWGVVVYVAAREWGALMRAIMRRGK